MKKILSMLLVVAMSASMSLVAFAAETNIMSIEIVETDAGITATVYVTNPDNVAGITATLKTPATLTHDVTTYTYSSDYAAANPCTPAFKSSTYVFNTSITAQADYVTKSGKVAFISFPLTRTDDSAVYTSADFSYGSGLRKATLTSGVTEYTSAANVDMFVAPVYVDDRTPVGGGEDPETPDYSATEEEVNATQDWTSGEFKYPTDKVGGTSNAAVGKKVAAFGKAATALTDGNYGIKIGNRFYPGRINVPQDSYFAIIVVNTNGDAAITGPYTYDIYTGTDADPTWVATGLNAVVE